MKPPLGTNCVFRLGALHDEAAARLRQVKHSKSGFSLVEVIIAIAVAGGALAVILALLSGLLRASADAADHQTALQLAGAIEARLYEEMGGTFPGGLQVGRVLVADKERTSLRGEQESDAVLTPAYFHIAAIPFTQPPLAYEAGRGVLPLRVRVSWPYSAVLSAMNTPEAVANTQSVEFVVTLTPP